MQLQEVIEWHEVMSEAANPEKAGTAQADDGGKSKKKDKKGKKGIAKELSDIVIYTRSVPFQSFEHSASTYRSSICVILGACLY